LGPSKKKEKKRKLNKYNKRVRRGQLLWAKKGNKRSLYYCWMVE
jgi:hypothetical protein